MRKIKEHYWLNKGGMGYPKTRPGDPPWGKIYIEKWVEVSKQEFEGVDLKKRGE